MRLDKWISHYAALTRLEARRAIQAQRVTVNAQVVKKIDLAVSDNDNITLDNEVIAALLPRYFMLYKPANYVCANSDSEHPIVLDLLHDEELEGLQIAGRLDIDTTGLLLITDDGAWNHRLTAPSRQHTKTYHVTLQEAVSDDAEQQLQRGLLLRGETKPTRPAQLVFPDSTNRRHLHLTISEGKYHQVKRMFAATGNHVMKLHRQQIGNIVLDGTLKPGEFRALTIEEINSIQ